MAENKVHVRMLFDKRGGGRYDGRQWPAYGEMFLVPEWEANELIACGDAELATEPERDRGWNVLREPQQDLGDSQEEEPTALSNSDLGDEDITDTEDDDFYRPDDSDGDPDDEDDFARDDAPERPVKAERPAVGDRKAAWVKYATQNGATIAEADGMTKADLIARYGK